jgi:hypothetical protein
MKTTAATPAQMNPANSMARPRDRPTPIGGRQTLPREVSRLTRAPKLPVVTLPQWLQEAMGPS